MMMSFVRGCVFGLSVTVFGVALWLALRPTQREGRIMSQAEDVQAWWETKAMSIMGQGSVDMIQMRWAEDELRRQLAPQMQRLIPWQSTCGYCRWPWALTDGGHTVYGKAGHGGFAVCERCWKFLRDTDGGDDHLRLLYQESRRRHWPDFTAEEIDAAIDASFREDSASGRMRSISPLPLGTAFSKPE